MTNHRKQKLNLILIKLSEVKVLCQDLNISTYLLDCILNDIRTKINKKDFPPVEKQHSVYSYLVEVNYLMSKLQVYKRSENIKNKILDIFERVKIGTEDKPEWKIGETK